MKQSRAEEVREKIEEAATRIHGRAPQLKTLAEYINQSGTGYTAQVEKVHYLRRVSYRSNLRKAYRQSDRTANKLTVWRSHGATLKKAYELDPTATYDTGVDACRWIVHNVIAGLGENRKTGEE